MIPKIIHCCWFGGNPLPKSVKKFMDTWRKQLPDYEVIVWTEKEFDPMASIPYVREAYMSSKFAFVSDYVRLYALDKFGGIYMDTDVEVIKSLDTFLNNEAFMSFESNDKLSTAIIASVPSASWIKNLLVEYENRRFIIDGKLDLTTNVEFITERFIRDGLKTTNEYQDLDGISIYPSEYFSPKSWGTGVYNITDKTVAIHHFAGTWHSRSTRMLSCFFSNNTIVKIAALKERITNTLKNVFTKS